MDILRTCKGEKVGIVQVDDIDLVGCGLLVALSRCGVLGLVKLVAQRILSCGGTSADILIGVL
eukprot:c49327_g1_i1 orf=2-187(-)